MKKPVLAKRWLSVALAAAITVGAAFPLSAQQAAAPAPAASSVGVPDPAREITDLARLFRAGDLAGLAQRLTPRSKWEAARQAFETKRRDPASDAERARFADKVYELTAPDAVDKLMAKIEPELVKARPQWPGMLLMGLGAVQVAVNSPESKLTAAQREAIEVALPGFRRWATSTDFLSSDSMRRALTVLTEGVRATGITGLEQIETLPLEAVLDRAAPMLTAAKEAARVYGIDLDAVADSLKVDVIEQGADTARVRTTVTLFGAPVWVEHDLVLVEGHWYGKHALAEFHDHHDDHDSEES